MRRGVKIITFAVALILAGLAQWAVADPPPKQIEFDMMLSAGAKDCLPNATGHVVVTTLGPVESMVVTVSGLRPKTEFDFFVIQVPTAPFGLAWYQGDIVTDANGNGSQAFVGRFSIETFIVAPGVADAPFVFDGPFPDATSNPATPPVQLYHLGLWFGSPFAASKAGCPSTITPFNGEHRAGIQVLNTNNFPTLQGPLMQLQP